MAPTLAALALAAALFQDPVPAAPAPAPPQGDLIPLRDGQIVVGEITSHGEDGIDVTRLDNGGVVHLRWSHLTPPAEQRLRAELGYVADDATDEILVEGDEVVFLDGTRKVGLLDPTSTPDVIRLNEKGNVWVYTRDKLAGAPAKVRVSALSLYTRDQLYAQWSSELDLSTPAGNLELASRLERVRDYARALDHVRKAAELDASWRPQEIASRRARLEERSKRQAEYDQIAEIDVQRNRRRWDAALGLADEFLSKYPKSPSKPDVEKKKTTIQAARQTDLVRRTFELWSMQMERLVSKKAIDRTLDLEAAKAWATGELKELVRAEVAKALKGSFADVDESVVSKTWPERLKAKPGPQPHHASYGAGTFALGKQKATAGLLDKGAGDKKESPKTKEEEEMEKRMQRFLERQQGQSGKSAGPKKQSAEEWWAQASSIERRWWLQAYYAEFSGDMTVKPDKRRCQQCGGKGKLEFLSTGGGAPPDTGARSGSGSTSTSNDAGVSSVECPLCHGLCLERVVTYR